MYCIVVPCFRPAKSDPSLTEHTSLYTRVPTAAEAIGAQWAIREGYMRLRIRVTVAVLSLAKEGDYQAFRGDPDTKHSTGLAQIDVSNTANLPS